MGKPSHDILPRRTVSRLTGLPADVIRVWEKRDGVVSPERGPRGVRLYSTKDIARLPATDLASAARRAGAAVVGLELVSTDNRADAVAEIRPLERQLPAGTELWLGGRAAAAAAREQGRSRAVSYSTGCQRSTPSRRASALWPRRPMSIGAVSIPEGAF